MNNYTPIITLHPKSSRPVERIPNGTRVAVQLGGDNWLPGKIVGCTFGREHRYDIDLDMDNMRLFYAPALRVKQIEMDKP